MKAEVLIPREILEQPDLPIHVKLVYGRVAVLIEKTGSAVLTTDELARQCGITRRQAAKSLPYLVTLGLVRPHESLSGRGLLRVFQKAAPAEAEKQK
jgi:predicted transcriptional regulator